MLVNNGLMTLFYRPCFPIVSRLLSLSSTHKGELEYSEDLPNIFHVKLNRPERRNAFTFKLWKEMKIVFDKLAEESKCRVIVLSGNGKSFCGGIDLQQGMGELISLTQDESLDIGRKAREIRKIIKVCQEGYTAIETCPKPVIAAIHSHCIGAGVNMITACDIRYASQDALFNIKEVDIGMAADVGTLNRIQKIVGNDSWTREIAYTAKDVTADEALKFGLISRIFSSRETVIKGAMALAEKIAKKSPIAVQGTKEVLNHARDHSISDSLDFVRTWNMSQMLSSDLRDGALAAMNKKQADYKNV